jgi:hypothetical protein
VPTETRPSRDLRKVIKRLAALRDSGQLPTAPCAYSLSYSRDWVHGLARELSESEHERFREWLIATANLHDESKNETDRLELATGYMVILQVWLDFQGIEWPLDGVFPFDLRAKRRGRPRSDLGFECWRLKESLKTWRAVAREVLPAEFKKNPAKATKKVADLARSFGKGKSTPTIGGISETIFDLLCIRTTLELASELRQSYQDELGDL